jgi:hypothetical protein
MDNKMDNNENIFFFINEEETNEQNEINEVDFELNHLLFDSKDTIQEDFIFKMVEYNDNFTVKELLLICEYYEIAKELKSKKCNKDEIIQFLILFETNKENENIVIKRKKLWFYIDELKKDKFMKKFIIF